MAKIVVTAANINAAFKSCADGDTLELTGDFPGLGLAARATPPVQPIILDCKAATFSKLSYMKNVAGVNILGGVWREGLRMDGGERIKVKGGKFIGPFSSTTFAAIHINWMRDVEVSGTDVSGIITGMILQGIDGLLVEGNYLHELRSDGIDIGGVRNAVVRSNVITSPNPQEGDHPDGIQVLQAGASNPVENVLIEGNVIVGRMQGIFGGNGPYKNLTIRGNRISSGFVNGIGFGSVTGLVLEDNEVSTLPGSPWQSRITSSNSTDVVLKGDNVAKAYGVYPEQVLSRADTEALRLVTAERDQLLTQVEALKASRIEAVKILSL